MQKFALFDGIIRKLHPKLPICKILAHVGSFIALFACYHCFIQFVPSSLTCKTIAYQSYVKSMRSLWFESVFANGIYTDWTLILYQCIQIKSKLIISFYYTLNSPVVILCFWKIFLIKSVRRGHNIRRVGVIVSMWERSIFPHTRAFPEIGGMRPFL